MTRPSILLITCDELRADFLDCYGGNGLVATPNIDALAARGTVWDRAYAASPICLPSRCALLSGLYPHRNGAYSNFRDARLSPSQPNCYNTLRDAGYHTAHFGKCHYTATPYHQVRGDRTLEREPVKGFYLSLGLDHLDLCNGKNNSLWFWNDYSRELEGAGLLDAYRRRNAENQNSGKSFPFPGPVEWHPDWWCARKCRAHLATIDSDQPCFAWLSIPGPHYPHDPTPEYLDRVDVDRLPLLRGDESEFAERDRVQYDAFHGGRRRGCEGMGAHRLWGKNACGYEEVLRVPLIVEAPDMPRGRSDARVALIDLLPSFCRWAGCEAPSEIDGRALQRSVDDGGHELLLASMEQQIIVHDVRWKLVIDRALELSELYDRTADPEEYHNRIADPTAADHRARLERAAIASLVQASLR